MRNGKTTTAPAEPQGFATIKEAMKFLAVSRTSIYAMAADGSLPAKRLPGIRSVRIPWRALYELAKS